jgi:hypothetical protein
MVPRCHMSVSADRSAGRPTTGWCRDSFRMVKHNSPCTLTPASADTSTRCCEKLPHTAQTRAHRNGLSCTMLIHSIRSPIRRLPEHRMVPADVCDGQEQARSTSGGREVDLTTRRCVCQRRSRNGSTVTDVRYNIHSSTNGLPEHRMVPADVCDGQEQGRSTLDGREVDRTTRF